jgi:type IV pilus assembly protein PilO
MRQSAQWKRVVRAIVAVLLAMDVILVGVLWRAARSAPEDQRKERDRLQAQARLYSADVKRAEAIKAHLSELGRDADKFYKEDLVSAASGYSDVIADLGTIAAHSGVKTSLLSFRQDDLKGRAVTEIRITAGVEGDYASLIHFINGLERSKNFYLLDSLTLASGSTGGVRLNLDLRTYFRS